MTLSSPQDLLCVSTLRRPNFINTKHPMQCNSNLCCVSFAVPTWAFVGVRSHAERRPRAPNGGSELHRHQWIADYSSLTWLIDMIRVYHCQLRFTRLVVSTKGKKIDWLANESSVLCQKTFHCNVSNWQWDIYQVF